MSGYQIELIEMAKYDELRKDPVISQWVDTIRKKPRTVKGYLMGLQKYIEFTCCTPEELLTEAEEEAATQVVMRKRKLLARLLAFRKYLEEDTDYAPTSKRNYMNAVYSFYRASYVEVPKLMGSQHAGKELSLSHNHLFSSFFFSFSKQLFWSTACEL
jgi:hypothetical protein